MKIVRKTKSVELLRETFNKSQSAISVVSLIDKFKGDMNKTTIYRILDRFEHDGIVHSFMGIDGLKWYAKCSSCTHHEHVDAHPHFQCQDCGKLDCLDTEIKIPKITNRTIDYAQILLVGKCEECCDD